MIVGNAPCADTEKVRELMNQHELVLRMNQFAEPTSPPKHITDRCDIWGVNKIHEYIRPTKPHLTWWTAYTATKGYEKRLRETIHHYDAVIPRELLVSLFKLTGGRNPTTGFMMIHMALDLGYRPTVCGFDWFKSKQVHWWHMDEDEKGWHQRDVFNRWHNPVAEKRNLFKLAREGSINLVKS